MTSDKQAQANRRNALKSTGPNTPEGKAVVRYNAIKHGLLSEDVVLVPGEDEAALRELGELLREELQPVGELENLLVDRISAAHWRLRRLNRVEAGLFVNQGSVFRTPQAERTDNIDGLGLSFLRDSGEANAFSKLSRYEATIERSLYKALHELQRLQAARREEGNVPPPVAVDVEVSRT
jgi:hypothetical protein